MFITGSQVIKSVIGEEVTAETLGGAKTHNTTSGVAHFIAENDNDCIEKIRERRSFLPSNNLEGAPVRACTVNAEADQSVKTNEILAVTK